MADDTAFSLLKQRSIGSSRAVFRPRAPTQVPEIHAPPPRSLYIHIPFCTHKCHYCDFYSIVDTRDRQDAFVSRLVRELQAQAPFATDPLHTIFVGGGTPSLLRPDLWQKLLKAMRTHLDLSMILSGEGEFSVECNPETVTDELAAVLQEGGVNRASLGAQSFNQTHLKTLERWHNPEKVQSAIETLRAAGITRCSLDLIYAIPGQSMDEWDRDLRTALAMPIEHLSAYALTFEPGTAMTARLVRGEFTQRLMISKRTCTATDSKHSASTASNATRSPTTPKPAQHAATTSHTGVRTTGLPSAPAPRDTSASTDGRTPPASTTTSTSTRTASHRCAITSPQMTAAS
ncbi:MAG: coproporphyrinogen-III oxidase family protein [Phycisphaerales bacterium]